MIGEKFIEKKIEGNKIIRIHEFKNFDYDYNKIINFINDYVTDGPEELYTDYGIVVGYDDFYSFDCDDKCLEKVEEIIKERSMYDEPSDYYELQSFIEPLKKARGYLFYLDDNGKLYEEKK